MKLGSSVNDKLEYMQSQQKHIQSICSFCSIVVCSRLQVLGRSFSPSSVCQYLQCSSQCLLTNGSLELGYPKRSKLQTIQLLVVHLEEPSLNYTAMQPKRNVTVLTIMKRSTYLRNILDYFGPNPNAFIRTILASKTTIQTSLRQYLIYILKLNR